MLLKLLHLFLLVLTASSLAAEPLLSSWHTLNSGQYARIYETTADQITLNAVTTWTASVVAAVVDSLSNPDATFVVDVHVSGVIEVG